MSDNDLQTYVASKVASGQFGNAEEFATEAIRVYRKIERDHAELCSAVQERIARADAGDLVPLDIDALKQQLAEGLSEDGTKKANA
jgi:Arc/MetJ-type ribon-helix-helix transcriptional regulator